MRAIFLILFATLTAHAAAQDNFISLHLDCLPPSDTCVEFPMAAGGSKFFNKTPELILGTDQFEDIWIAKGDFGEDVLSFKMTNEFAERFAELTAKNIGRAVAIVSEGKVITDPVIKSEIKGGNVQINSGADRTTNLEQVPWIKARLEKGRADETRSKAIQLYTILIGGLLLLLGAVYYGFLYRGTKA